VVATNSIRKGKTKAVWDGQSEYENKTTKNHQITAFSFALRNLQISPAMDSVITQDPSGSPYINDIECQPPSPESNLSHLDSTLTFNPLASPPYNGSYNGSPYSGHSELSYIEDFPNLFDDGITFRDYDPAEYDPPDTSSLLMFSDTDFVQPPYDATLSVGSSDLHSTQPYDYSSPSSNASATDDRIRSRASSVSSNPHSHQHTPLIYTSTLDVALENMKFSHSPNWGTDPLPHNEPMQKHPSPPRLLMPEAPPTINVPDGDGLGDGSGPSLNIVPATPISGGGLTSDNTVPFQTRLENLTGAASYPVSSPRYLANRSYFDRARTATCLG